MCAFMSLDQKCTLLFLVTGLTLLVSGGVFFLISAGLAHPSWQILGITGLALGILVLTAALVIWLGGIHRAGAGSDGRRRGSSTGRDETETINTTESVFQQT